MFLILGREVEKDAFCSLAYQAAVNAIGQVLEHLTHATIQQGFQILEQKLATHQFDKLLLDHFAVFLLDTPQRVEVLRVDNLSKNANIQETAAVNTGNLLREAFDQAKQLFQSIVREHVQHPQGVEAGSDAINAARALHHTGRIPVQIIVDEDTAVLQVLPFRKHIGRDHDIYFAVTACYLGFVIGTRRELRYQFCALASIGSAVHTPNTWLTGAGPPLDRCRIIAAQLPVEIASGIFVIGEDQHLLTPQFSG